MSNMFYAENAEDFIFDEEATFEEGCKKESDVEVDADVDKEVEECGVMECYDDPEVACYRIALENEQNYNSIMTAIAMNEMVALESGQEVVYEAGKVKEFFGKIKTMVLKFWEKLQGAFKAAINKIGTYVSSNKKFVEKYKGQKMVKPEKSKDFKGYTFDGLGKDKTYFDKVSSFVIAKSDVNDIMSMSKAAADVIEKTINVAESKDIIRGLACSGEKKAIKSEDFSKELKIHVFGSEKKKEIDLKDFATLISDLEGAKEQKDDLNAAFKDARKQVKTHLSVIKKAESTLKKNAGRGDHGMRIAKAYTDLLNSALSIMSATIRMHMNAAFTKCVQDRAMASFYVSNQPKDQKESAIGFLDDVELV